MTRSELTADVRGSHGGGPGTAANIAARVSALYGRDVGRRAPVLALGTFERVGSNWLSDSLRAAMPQHNEPFRQQLGREHPLSPGNWVPADPAGTALGPLGTHHLACALADLYGRPRHLVKETNLFFATGTVLGLLPHSPVVVLTRAPVGIASSFERGGLWERWDYGQRYAQVAACARAPRRREWAPLVPLDDPAPPAALGRLIALNALLLAEALAASGRSPVVVSYERHVRDRPAVLADLARRLGITLAAQEQAPAAASGRGYRGRPAVPTDPTFATTGGKDDLVADLDPEIAQAVSSQTAATLERAGHFLDAAVTATAAGWLAGDDRYQVRMPAARRRTPARLQPLARPLPAILYQPVTAGVFWRNLLVTNAEMAELLTMLHAAGLPNTQHGTNLLICPMPHERGGRLHFDAPARRWRVSPGYDTHPAFWVTWLGAATAASWLGARLPTRAEASEATAGAPVTNCDYQVGDTLPVIEPGRGPAQVHHLVGNLQIWCGDGPALPLAQPVQRYMFGAAWNTPGTTDAITAVRSRYLLGSSRGVGVRLVRDARPTAATGLGAWELAHQHKDWLGTLDGPPRPLGDLDRRLITALTG